METMIIGILTIVTVVCIFVQPKLAHELLELMKALIVTYLLGRTEQLKQFSGRLLRMPVMNWAKIKNFVEGERKLTLSPGMDIRYSLFSMGEAYLQLNYKIVLPLLLVVMSLFSFALALFKIIPTHANLYMAFPLPIGAMLVAYAYHKMNFFNIKESKWKECIVFVLIGLLLILMTRVYLWNL